jgi:hypothetical protein
MDERGSADILLFDGFHFDCARWLSVSTALIVHCHSQHLGHNLGLLDAGQLG